MQFSSKLMEEIIGQRAGRIGSLSHDPGLVTALFCALGCKQRDVKNVTKSELSCFCDASMYASEVLLYNPTL